LTRASDPRIHRRPATFTHKGRPSWNRGLTKETDERVARASEKLRGHPVSEKIFSSYRRGRTTMQTVKGEIITVRSTFEVTFVGILEGDSEVLEFLYEAVNVRYFWQGHWHVTRPDFLVRYVSGEVALIEVKPPWQVSYYQQVRVEMLAMREFAVRFGLVFRWWDGGSYRELEV